MEKFVLLLRSKKGDDSGPEKAERHMNDTRMRIHDRKKTSIGDQSEGCRTEETKRDTKKAPFLTAQQKGYQINRKNQDRLKSNPYDGKYGLLVRETDHTITLEIS